jgi:hypothetical protein
MGVLTEEIIRLTQIVEEGNYLREEVVSLSSKTKDLQRSIDERDQQIAQLTQAQANAEKMVLSAPCISHIPLVVLTLFITGYAGYAHSKYNGRGYNCAAEKTNI